MIGEFPGPREARRAGQPPRDLRLPRRLRLAARAVAGHGRRRDHSRSRQVRPPEARQVIATALALLTLAAPAPARVQVGADEFSYSLSRQSIKAGPAIVQLVNYGEDEHDLRTAARRRDPGLPHRESAPGPPRRARGALPPRPFHPLVLARRSPQARHERHARRPSRLTSAARSLSINSGSSTGVTAWGSRCGGSPASIGCDVHSTREPSCRCSTRSSRCSPVVRLPTRMPTPATTIPATITRTTTSTATTTRTIPCLRPNPVADDESTPA